MGRGPLWAVAVAAQFKVQALCTSVLGGGGGGALHYNTCCNFTCKLYMMLSDVHLRAYKYYVGLKLNCVLPALFYV